jgi:hypothetical protein
MTIEFKELFPTVVLFDENIELANKMLPLCDSYIAESTTNCLHTQKFPTTLYNRTQEANVNSEPLVHEFFNYVLGHSLKSFLDYRKIGIPREPRPFGFFNSMEKYAYLRKHSHLDCSFSGVFYLEVGEDVPPLVLYDSRPVRHFVSYPFQEINSRNEQLHVIYPKKGMILLWDSYLEHEVYQKLNDNPRKTFVFNI